MAAIVRPRLYSHLALFLAAFTFVAFSRTYYLRVFSDLPAMTQIVHLHGMVSTAWMLLFVAQTRLVAGHRVDLHMKLGILGLVFAVAMVVTAFLTTIGAAGVPQVRPNGLTQAQFTAIQVMSTGLFAACVALGLWLRRRSDFHKRLMVLAMVAVIGPAVGRLVIWMGFAPYTSYFNTAAVALLVTGCLAYDWRRHGIAHPVFAYGGLLIVLSWPFRYWLARSDFYSPVADWFSRAGAAFIG
ncbi:MAG: hypothetical protein H7Y89_19515 [Steroidobacteraceae bacterium]|nr:hypothetical protein [Steroidobacteraceae bacterium]